ncbi:hypothetical protein U8326_14060 [Tsuneonella sp. CC-YZS046]|uniref:DUF7007 domain-containing protein n=1 Tax=Tsuneonella sp. CC-YZS046 TaxID=3042152 RepID=UPI000BD89D32|nr:hypothetical protein [Tsuneonella sp. CC-YZS046]OYX62661.1 MAG: hypothetical protein B7Y88_14025 [Sphingomonadales bacterium 32-64-17]WRO66153.1 hypothetical protein U8326_14060 [Tsuneonella sp. CC-YZS046]
MNAAAPIQAVYGRTADEHLAALVGDNAYLALPVGDGFRLATAWRINRPIAEWRRDDFYGFGSAIDGETEFRVHVEEQAHHQREKTALDRQHQPSDLWTPWGGSQGGVVYAEGVVFHHTAGHGGFNLDEARNAAMPAALRIEPGWYEEDCDWAMVAFGFPELFTAYERRIAEKTLRDTFPDRWEAVHGRSLAPGESFSNDRRLFEEAHAQDWIVISASMSGSAPGFVKCVATLGGKRDWRPYRGFLVPKAEYRSGPHGFMIDETRHETWELPTAPDA